MPDYHYRRDKAKADVVSAKLEQMSRWVTGNKPGLFGFVSVPDASHEISVTSPIFLKSPYAAFGSKIGEVLLFDFLKGRGLADGLSGPNDAYIRFSDNIQQLRESLAQRVDEVFGASGPVLELKYTDDSLRFRYEAREVVNHPNGRWYLLSDESIPEGWESVDKSQIYAVWDKETGKAVLIAGEVEDGREALTALRDTAKASGFDLAAHGLQLNERTGKSLAADYVKSVNEMFDGVYLSNLPVLDEGARGEVFDPESAAEMYNADNVTMRESERGFEMFPQELRVILRGRVSSVKEAKKKFGLLSYSDQQENATIIKSERAYTGLVPVLSRIMDEVSEEMGGEGSWRDSFDGKHDILQAIYPGLQAAAKRYVSDPSYSGFSKAFFGALNERGENVFAFAQKESAHMDDLMRTEFFEAAVVPWFEMVKNAKSEYFEQKQNRLTSFRSVAAMAVPNDKMESVRVLLKDYPGISLYGYNPEDSKSRVLATYAAAKPNVFAPKKAYNPLPSFGLPGFYSRLEKEFTEKMGNSATVEQVRALLKGKNAEEVEWSSVESFLEGKEKVDKAELLAFLRANAVRIEEVVKSDKPHVLAVVERGGMWVVTRGGVAIEGETYTDEDEATDALNTIGLEDIGDSSRGYRAETAPKFSQYQPSCQKGTESGRCAAWW